MKTDVFKVIEIAGQSEKGFEDAIHRALERANRSVHGISWFEVAETRGHVENGKAAQWQVVLKVGFSLDA